MTTKLFIPAIVLLFIELTTSLSVVAQDKNTFKVKNTSFEYSIDKNTKDADLEQIKKEVNDEKIAKLEFSNIKRNENGNLIAITTKFEDKRGSSQENSQYSSVGISPFSVIIHENENGNKYLEIKQGNLPGFKNLIPSNQAFSQLYEDDTEDEQHLYTDHFSKSIQEIREFQEEIYKQQQELLKNLFQSKEDKKE